MLGEVIHKDHGKFYVKDDDDRVFLLRSYEQYREKGFR